MQVLSKRVAFALLVTACCHVMHDDAAGQFFGGEERPLKECPNDPPVGTPEECTATMRVCSRRDAYPIYVSAGRLGLRAYDGRILKNCTPGAGMMVKWWDYGPSGWKDSWKFGGPVANMAGDWEGLKEAMKWVVGVRDHHASDGQQKRFPVYIPGCRIAVCVAQIIYFQGNYGEAAHEWYAAYKLDSITPPVGDPDFWIGEPCSFTGYDGDLYPDDDRYRGQFVFKKVKEEVSTIDADVLFTDSPGWRNELCPGGCGGGGGGGRGDEGRRRR